MAADPAAAATLPGRSAAGGPLAALILGGIAVGLSPLFVRLSELGPVATAFHRVLWALPLLWLWMRVDEARAGKRAPIATPRAWYFLKERVRGRFLLGMVLALAGAAPLAGASAELGGRYLLGDAFGLVTALFFGAYMVAIAALRTVAPASRIMFWSTLVTCLGLLPLSLAVGESLWPTSPAGLGVLIALAWISHCGGQGLIAYALGRLPASYSSLVILIEPLTAAMVGWIWLGEALGPLQIAAGTVVLFGIVLARPPRGG